MKKYQSQIVIGLGSGRCGTMSLAYLLNWQTNSEVSHEKSRYIMPWKGGEKTIDKFLNWASEVAKQKRLVGDVALYYLNYVEYLLSLNPHIKFFCLQRDRASTVASYMKHTKDRNHWMPHDGIVWQKHSWDNCYPKYEVLSKENALERYWDDYYLTANQLQTKYPHSFRLFQTTTLNTEAGQKAILSFLGIENMRLSLGIHFNSARGIKTYLTRFSVIIFTHNHPDLLKNLLSEVCQQSIGDSEFEVIVVDNNYQTRFLTESFCQRYPNVRYCFEPKQGIFCVHRRGWREARGQYVVYIDDNCQVPIQWLTVANEIIEQHTPTMFSLLPYYTFYHHSIKYEDVTKDSYFLNNYKPKPSNDWQLHWLDDQPMLFSKSHDGLHLLNPVAGFIWTCCDGKTNVRAIRNALQEIFVENQDEVAKDLPNILESWQENGLIYPESVAIENNYLKTKLNKQSQLDTKSQQLQQDLTKNRAQEIYSSSCPYCLTISDTKKFMWFRVSKVCTSTIYSHLRRNVYLSCVRSIDILYPINLYKDYFKFAFVRNPWDRLVSCWYQKVIDENYFEFNDKEYEKMQHFENFVNYVSSLNIETCDRHLRLQSRLIDINQIDYIGRFERFEEDYTTICRKLDIPLEHLPHENKSSKTKKYKEFYTEELRNKVYQIYLKDIQIFGYQF